MLTKTLILLVVLAVSVEFAHGWGRRRGGGWGGFRKPAKFLGRMACKIVNITEDVEGAVEEVIVKERNCGCQQKVEGLCTLGPLTLTDRNNNTIRATFCNVTTNLSSDSTPRIQWGGVLKGACRIYNITASPNTTLKSESCWTGGRRGSPSPCLTNGTNYIDTTINGTAIRSFFCNSSLNANARGCRRHGRDSSSSDDDSSAEGEDDTEEEEEDKVECVPLNRDDKPERSEGSGRGDRFREFMDRVRDHVSSHFGGRFGGRGFGRD